MKLVPKQAVFRLRLTAMLATLCTALFAPDCLHAIPGLAAAVYWIASVRLQKVSAFPWQPWRLL